MLLLSFQLTTSRRGRQGSCCRSSEDPPYFNSLPHAEVDRISSRTARRLQHFNSLPHAEVDNHYKSTSHLYIHFNSLPHAEVDRNSCFIYNVFLLFQLTTSRRGRLPAAPLWTSSQYFNSLPHAEVDTVLLTPSALPSTFQLTTSRRGRQQFVTKSMDINHRFHNKSHNKSLFFALIILCLSIFH